MSATAEIGSELPSGSRTSRSRTAEARSRSLELARRRMSSSSSRSRNSPTSCPRICAARARLKASAGMPRAAQRSRSGTTRTSGLPGSTVVATSRAPSIRDNRPTTTSEASSSTSSSSAKTLTSIGACIESTDGRTSSDSTRGKRSRTSRTRATASVSASAGEPGGRTKLTWARFSPRVCRPEAVDGRLPTTENTRAKLGSPTSRRSISPTIREVLSRVVSSGRRNWKANSPWARSGTRLVPSPRPSWSAAAKSAIVTASTSQRIRRAPRRLGV